MQLNIADIAPRTLRTSSKVLNNGSLVSLLSKMTILETLCIAFSPDGLRIFQTRLNAIMRNIAINCPVLCGYSGRLISLKITRIEKIDKAVLREISAVLPNLRNLWISTTDAITLPSSLCCTCCYLDALGSVVHSPVPDVWLTSRQLTVSLFRSSSRFRVYLPLMCLQDDLASGLEPLKKLKTLFIGLFLSHSALLDAHCFHLPSWSMDLSTWKGISTCARCERVGKKDTMDREIRASLLLAERLQSLEIVGWSTVFPHGGEEPISEKTYVACCSSYGPAASLESEASFRDVEVITDGACSLSDPFPPSVAGFKGEMEFGAGDYSDDGAPIKMQAIFRVARNVEVDEMCVTSVRRIV